MKNGFGRRHELDEVYDMYHESKNLLRSQYHPIYMKHHKRFPGIHSLYASRREIDRDHVDFILLPVIRHDHFVMIIIDVKDPPFLRQLGLFIFKP